MKKVWAHRIDDEGISRPTNKWKLMEIEDCATHFYGACIEFEEKHHIVFDSGGVAEYVGNQRGDGWFYIEDGDLPPIENNAVLCHDGHGLLLMMPADLHKKDAWNHRNKAKCWMPVPDPKHLDEQ